MNSTILLLSLCFLALSGPQAPNGLMTDLLEDTESVFQKGFPSEETLETLNPDENQWAEIRTLRPSFSWIVNDERNDVRQTAYQIQIAENRSMAPILWDGGKVESDASSSVFLTDDAPTLREDAVYYWRVRTWNESGSNAPTPSADAFPAPSTEVSPWSQPKGFRIGKNLKSGEISRYPIRKIVELPIATIQHDAQDPNEFQNSNTTQNSDVSKNSDVSQAKPAGRQTWTFFDFGRAAFGQIRVTVEAERAGTLLVRVGERVKDGAVDRKPAGSTRYWEYRVPVEAGLREYLIETRRDPRNSSGAAFLMPAYVGEVMPFRYAEVEETDTPIRIEKVERLAAYYHFNDFAARFHSSNETLNQVWELCRYSIKATSFLGVYVDGDRERIPYEGDALLNQLSHYCVDREYSMARFSWEYLIFHPTWPTEWHLQCCQMAWYDYLYSGDVRGIARCYDELKTKSLIGLAEPNGLISTRKGKVTPEFLKSLHLTSGPQFRDIVDWPHKGLAGNENAQSGETDGFVFEDFNSVVNAYHFFALNSMLHFAQILGKTEDAAFWEAQITQMRQSYQTVFFDPVRGIYRDGETTDHASLHANIFPLAFGLVPEANRKSVTDFVKSRGMKCSVYGAQFLLEGVFNGLDGAYGLERMTANDLRSWQNMIRVGSTISLEAWDDRYKPNQDWNHAWGAAPANILPRKLVGVEPLEPGCARIRIQPQPASLESFDAVVPTIRGSVHVAWSQRESTLLEVETPANVTADVFVPTRSPSARLTLNGKPIDAPCVNGFFVLKGIGSGHHVFEVR